VAKSLLLEIGCEELPAGVIQPALEQLGRLASEGLGDARLAHGALRTMGTPRRLALLVEQVADRQEDREREATGPAVRVAFDAEGRPTGAALGFAKSAGVPVESLGRVQTPKGEYLLARIHEAGRATQAVLPALLQGWIAGLTFPKSMQWNGTGRFSRPVRWIVALLGGEVLSVAAFGISSGRRTRGRRLTSPDTLEVARPEDYVEALRRGSVLVEPSVRKAETETALRAAASRAGGRIVEDPDLLDEVTNLVEWPGAILGRFEERYLELPRPIIVTAMRAHQRYFSVERDGGLLPCFVAIRNGSGAGEEEIRKGNELVLRARLEDARFYWTRDTRHKLEERVPDLKGIVWHEKLGSVFDRVQRIVALVEDLAQALAPNSRAAAGRAAYLCKADLASEMIRDGKEFTTLQGIIGAEYAAASGEAPEVVLAIREHGLPQGPADPLPSSPEGTLLALADRLDVIVGGFRAGLSVSGSQDPYGLRRAGNGIVRILLEKRWRLDVIAQAGRLERIYERAGVAGEGGGDFAEFWSQRLASALEAQGIAPDTAAAVLAVRPGDPVDVLSRAKAVDAIRQTADFEGLMIGYRRVANLLRTANPADVRPPGQPLAERPEAFKDPAEAELHLETKMARQAVETYIQAAEPDYGKILGHLLGLRPPIDRFFEAVMVMADDPETRRRRLGILEAVRQAFLRIADFSALSTAPGQKSV
jgi:glycyl-tRNA synthetase beta chain